jgi:F0F1-type ATP synthase membrane subunit c/vacuolar-type H+-ATPase subunit K
MVYKTFGLLKGCRSSFYRLGIGQGTVTGQVVEGITRQPEAKGKI